MLPNEEYFEPRLSRNGVLSSSSGYGRFGRNIKGNEKVLAEKGDLIIATLHTQDCLFAYSDKTYVTTSQIVAKVKEDLVSKAYLAFVLNKILPTIRKSDLVGRETYKNNEILSLRIPKPSNKDKKFFSVLENELTNKVKQVKVFVKDDNYDTTKLIRQIINI